MSVLHGHAVLQATETTTTRSFIVPQVSARKTKQPTKRANSGFYQKQFVNHFLESFCFSRSDVVHFVSFVQRNSGLLQLASSHSNLLVLL